MNARLGVAGRDGMAIPSTEESLVKKGRHRRFEEARSLKRAVVTESRRCAECGAGPDDEHASWCLAEADELEELLGNVGPGSARSHSNGSHEDDPLYEDDPLDD